MHTSLLSLLLSSSLLSPSGILSAVAVTGSPLAVVEAHSHAWAVVHGGGLWICWSEGRDCWRRVELEADSVRVADPFMADDLDDDGGAGEDLTVSLESRSDLARDAVGADDWRLGFAGSQTLWIELGAHRWRVDRGHHRARLVRDAPPITLNRPRRPACGPTGQTPAVLGGRLGWSDALTCVAPSSAPAPSCLTPVTPVALRGTSAGASGIHVRAGIELARRWDRRRTSGLDSFTPQDPGPVRQVRAELAVNFVVELRFDPTGGPARARARAALIRRSIRRDRTLPPVEPGPLASRERAALEAVVCGVPR